MLSSFKKLSFIFVLLAVATTHATAPEEFSVVEQIVNSEEPTLPVTSQDVKLVEEETPTLDTQNKVFATLFLNLVLQSTEESREQAVNYLKTMIAQLKNVPAETEQLTSISLKASEEASAPTFSITLEKSDIPNAITVLEKIQQAAPIVFKCAQALNKEAFASKDLAELNQIATSLINDISEKIADILTPEIMQMIEALTAKVTVS